ncbi:MAG: 50S ribosomal protein L11 methyltransferase [Methanobacteriaceae archaeon]
MEKRLVDILGNSSLGSIIKIKEEYNPCPNCINLNIKKFKAIPQQINLEELDNNFGRCECGRRHLDTVMVHVAKIMLDYDIPIVGTNLRNTGTPLLEFGFSSTHNTEDNIYLKENSLIILSKNITKECGLDIYENVSEVKGILKGDANKTVGIKEIPEGALHDTDINISSKSKLDNLDTLKNEYELLVGNDLRADIINTPTSPIIISKNQSKIHLEFSESLEIKINKLNNKLADYCSEELSNLKVLDGTCGTGALGIFLINLGVKKVVFNDIWPPAIETTKNNLFINKMISKEEFEDLKTLNNHSLDKKIEIYNLAIEEFIENWIIKNYAKFDLGIIDLFPGVNSEKIEDLYKKICKEIIII